MPPKSKVEKSPHYNEIVERLLSGESGRSVSKYLMDTYNEDIGYGAINSFKRNHLRIEERVEAEANKLLAQQQPTTPDSAEVLDDMVEEPIHETAKSQLRAEQSTQFVVKEFAEVIIGMVSVAKNYPSDYERMKQEADNPNSPVTWKDVAQMSQSATKTTADYSKSQDTNVEVNVNNLSTGFNMDKVRSILDAKRKRSIE